jgi:hypothetical protein
LLRHPKKAGSGSQSIVSVKLVHELSAAGEVGTATPAASSSRADVTVLVSSVLDQ